MSNKNMLLCTAAALNTGVIILINSIIQDSRDLPLFFALGVLLTLFMHCVSLLSDRMKWTAKLAAFVISVLTMWYFGAFRALYEFAVKYAGWIYVYDLAVPEPTRFGTLSSIILAGTVSAVFAELFIVRRPRILMPLAFYMILICLPYPYVDMSQFLFALNIITAPLIMLAVLSEYSRKSERYGDKIKARPYKLFAVPLAVLTVLVSFLLPWDDEAHPERIPKAFTDLSWGSGGFLSLFPSRYNLNDTGTVQLGGRSRMGSALLLEFTSEEPMYLYAECYDEYTGNSWNVTDRTLLPYSRRLYDLISIPRWATTSRTRDYEYGNVPFRGNGLLFEITYINLVTDMLVAPRGLRDIQADGRLTVMSAEMTLRTIPEMDKGSYYSGRARIFDMTEALEFDRELYEFVGGDEYNEHYRTAGILEMLNGFEGLHDPYDYARKFLRLPDTVTERTLELAGRVTAGKETYIEKAIAIQDYLARTYEYNLNSPLLPNGADFVDFFLFESQRGYCTSYATAMTVMLRALGIPARYCEGFAPNLENYTDGVFQIYESDAHAWVEAYVPYVGWVEFEPTGSSNAAAYRLNNMPTPTPTPTPSSRPDTLPMEEEIPPSPTPSSAPSPTPTPAGTVNERARSELEEALKALWGVVLRILLYIMPPALWIIGGRLYVIFKRRALKKAEATAQARFWYGRMLGLLRAEGLVKRKYETMREFVARVQENIPASGIDLMPAIALLEKNLYNGENIPADEISEFHSAHRQLSAGLHAGWGPLKRLWETNATWRLLW